MSSLPYVVRCVDEVRRASADYVTAEIERTQADISETDHAIWIQTLTLGAMTILADHWGAVRESKWEGDLPDVARDNPFVFDQFAEILRRLDRILPGGEVDESR